MEKSFVDKVYDAYIKEDYSYGDNNLNPKREIKTMSLKDTNEQLDRILASIQHKVIEISKKYPVDDFQIDDAIGNFGGSGARRKGIPPSLREAIHKAGGHGNNLVMIPSIEGDTSPIMAEIELAIAKILATIAANPTDTDEDKKVFEEVSNSGLDLFDISCNGTLSLIPGNVNSDSEEPEDVEDDGFVEQEKPVENDLFTNSVNDTASAVMEDAVNKALDRMEKDLANQQANARACAAKDLGLMKAFLAILKVIEKIKQAMDPLMNILMETIKIVVLAAGCWNNPTNVSEIIQRIVVKLVAILIMLVASTVQMFWNLLGLDCITKEAKGVIDQIKQSLSGVANTYNKCERFALSFGTDVEKLKDAFEEAKDAVDEALNNMTTDHLKEMFPNMGDLAKDIYNNGLGGEEGLKQSMIAGLQSTGAYNDIMSTIEDVKNMTETANTVIDSIMKSKGGKAATATVRKIAAQLHNVQAK